MTYGLTAEDPAAENAVPASLAVRLDRQPALLGAWQFLRDPLPAELAARAGYDYVCIDAQHGLHTFDSVLSCLAAAASGTAAPVVRAPLGEGWGIGRLLDAGAMGVIVPMVSTAADAEEAVRACRYPPLGERSFGPLLPAARYGAGYLAAANADVAVLPMIETAQAVSAVEDIAAVPGLAGLYVGPADLAMSMGLPPALDTDDAAFNAALARVVDACARRHIIPGIHATAALARKRLDQGFRMVTVTGDHPAVAAGFAADLRLARDAVASLKPPGTGATG
jgi:4-hydroxy-2-oxoheptanedioate aldolase